MAESIKTYLMFDGTAEAAIRLYVSLFAGAEITRLELRGESEPGKPGTVSRGTFRLLGQEYMAFDTPMPHAFGFTPAISLFVECDSEEELDRLHAALSEGGTEMMPPGDYG
ncbi:MAG TPA: VOC family protein, partial [Candidatus Eisenbacteria bacterium]